MHDLAHSTLTPKDARPLSGFATGTVVFLCLHSWVSAIGLAVVLYILATRSYGKEHDAAWTALQDKGLRDIE
jgi:hypothetical protein